MLKVKPPFNVSLPAQEAAMAALGDVAYMESNVKKILADRDLLYKKLGEKFKPVKPYGNFIFTETTPYSSAEFYDKLLKKGFITRPFGKPKGFSAEYCRITVGTTQENKKLMAALDTL
jgi:histidinol-phosphate aminotransferase